MALRDQSVSKTDEDPALVKTSLCGQRRRARDEAPNKRTPARVRYLEKQRMMGRHRYLLVSGMGEASLRKGLRGRAPAAQRWPQDARQSAGTSGWMGRLGPTVLTV